MAGTSIKEMRVAQGELVQRSGNRARRRSPVAKLLLVAIVAAIVAIAIVGDRLAAQYATRELRAQLVAELTNRGVEYNTAQVTIGGFPFLTQVATGRYDKISIDMTEVRLRTPSGRDATLPALHVVATGVDADAADIMKGTAKVVADQVTGTAVISFPSMENLVDYSAYNLTDVKFTEEAGGLRVNATANVAGIAAPISASATIGVTDGELTVMLRDAKAIGVEAPPAVRDYLSELVRRTLASRMPELPYSLTLSEVTVLPEGLAITATGHAVPLVS